MTEPKPDFLAILRTLTRHCVEFIIVGGVVTGAHKEGGLPVVTAMYVWPDGERFEMQKTDGDELELPPTICTNFAVAGSLACIMADSDESLT